MPEKQRQHPRKITHDALEGVVGRRLHFARRVDGVIEPEDAITLDELLNHLEGPTLFSPTEIRMGDKLIAVTADLVYVILVGFDFLYLLGTLDKYTENLWETFMLYYNQNTVPRSGLRDLTLQELQQLISYKLTE